MRARLVALLLGLLACSVTALPASARLLALVVGNNTYQEVPQLQTAVSDAQAMGEGLKRAGFSVTLVENGTKRQISRAIATVEGDISPGDTVVFHYSGHGIEIDGQNWLLPIDVPAARQGEQGLVKDESFNAADVIDRFRTRGAATVVAILDACRNNPFAESGTRALSGTRGLARMDADGGVFIMFSAGSKQEALDRLSPGDSEGTSVFVRSFLPLIGRQDMSLIDMAKETQKKVQALARSVGHDQVPAYYDGIVGRVTLTGTEVTARDQATEITPQSAPAVPLQNANSENLFWQSIANSSDPALFQAYLAQVQANVFPGTYKSLAEIKLASLQPKAPLPAKAPPAPTPPLVQSPADVGAGSPDVRACDEIADDPRDPDKPKDLDGVLAEDMAAPKVIEACGRAASAAGAPRRVFYALAIAYEKDGDAVRAAGLLDKAVALGHPIALYRLAERYLGGKGVAKDGPRAMSLFYKSADAGYSPAIARIAAMYAGGNGAAVDYRKAVALYQAAIEMKETSAYAGLGALYLNGRGVGRDKAKACDLFRTGAAQGSRDAREMLQSRCPPG